MRAASYFVNVCEPAHIYLDAYLLVRSLGHKMSLMLLLARTLTFLPFKMSLWWKAACVHSGTFQFLFHAKHFGFFTC